MDGYFIIGTIPKVAEPDLKESLIPFWGSGKSAIHHFQQGNYGRGVAYTTLAVTDVFLVKSLFVAGGKLIFKGGGVLLGKEIEQAVANFSVEGLKHAPSLTAAKAEDILVKVGTAEFKSLGPKISPGVQLAEIDGWFVKRVNDNASWFKKAWGKMSIKAQHEGLVKLGADMTPEFFIKDGILFTKSVGTTSPLLRSSTFWGSYFKGSYRMGTLLNDIRPRNMGLNGLIFDPALDPLMKALLWTALTPAGLAVSEYAKIVLRSQ